MPPKNFMVNGKRTSRVEVSALSSAMALLKMLLFMSLLGLFFSKVGTHNTTLTTIERSTLQALQFSSKKPPANKTPMNMNIVLTKEIVFTVPKIPRFYHIKVAHKNNLGNKK
jgi:hypothetical protein